MLLHLLHPRHCYPEAFLELSNYSLYTFFPWNNIRIAYFGGTGLFDLAVSVTGHFGQTMKSYMLTS